MTPKRIGVVFPGHGEQFIGMCKDSYDELRLVQEFFEQAAGTAEINFVKLLFASSEEEIRSIEYGYVALYLAQAATYEILYEKGLRPDFVAGHGIGEYAAAYASRSLSFVDGLYILNKYAQFYSEFLKDKNYTCLLLDLFDSTPPPRPMSKGKKWVCAERHNNDRCCVYLFIAPELRVYRSERGILRAVFSFSNWSVLA